MGLSSFFRRRPADGGSATAAKAAEAAKDRGNDHLARGEPERAAECYREAIRLLPTYAEAFVNLGFVRRQRKDYGEAERLLLQAAALKPSLWQAHFNLGVVAEETGRPDEAIARYRHVLAMSPSYRESHSWPEVHARLADLLMAGERYAEALPLFEELVAFNPGWLDAQCNIGTVLNKMGRNEEALAQYQRIADANPQRGFIRHFLGIVHLDLGHWREARDCCSQARALDPDDFDAQRDEAYFSLLLGDYENGWALHEAMLPGLYVKGHGKAPGLESDATRMRKELKPEKYWQGDDLGSKTLLLWTEQGLGDSLMMLRYLPLVRARGAGAVIVLCEQPLVRMAANLPGVDEVVLKPGKVDPSRFDRHCSMMSLPYLLGTRLETIPNQVPYLAIPADAKAMWAARLASRPGLRVGLVWAGNVQLGKDRERSIPLANLRPLVNVAGITWISLQKGPPAAQLKETGWPFLDWMDECADFLDTGALMESLDLVIAVDTSVVHLAGALGRPTWLFNRYTSEWRWMVEREDSPWYPTLRIFRQPTKGDWESVIRRMADELAALVGSRSDRASTLASP